MSEKEVNVILVGAKSIGQYGGYESFINKLLEYHKDERICTIMCTVKRMEVDVWILANFPEQKQ